MRIVERGGEKDPEPYLTFIMQKQNIDTMQAIHFIAKRIKKQAKHFSICGNKDKRGITT